jgi:hypothetical protein
MTTPPGDGQPASEQPSDPEPTQPLYGTPGTEPTQPLAGQPTSAPHDHPYQEQPTYSQPGYGQPGYGQSTYPPPSYAQPPYAPPGYGYAPPDHPKANTSLVLGILGLVACGILAPFAWSIGKKTVSEIDASQGRLGGRTQAQVGYILGIVGSAVLIAGVAFFVVSVVFFLVFAIGTASTTNG